MSTEIGVARQVLVAGVSEGEEALRLWVAPEDLEEDAHAAAGQVSGERAPRACDQASLQTPSQPSENAMASSVRTNHFSFQAAKRCVRNRKRLALVRSPHSPRAQ